MCVTPFLGRFSLKSTSTRASTANLRLVVEEREAGDEVVAQAVGASGKVVPNQLPESKHGKTSVVDLVRLARERSLFVHFDGKRGMVASDRGADRVVDGANGKERGDPEL
jgi:hypothetical protein